LPYRRGESVELTATEEVAAPVASDSEVERRVTTEEPSQEAEAGEELGEIEVFVDGQSVGRSPLVTREGYAEATLWDKARYAVGWPAERAWAWIWG
jgi:serine-type D-Ala-D-Ala carboxypeptidase (penicillin-binding protein 5/6)